MSPQTGVSGTATVTLGCRDDGLLRLVGADWAMTLPRGTAEMDHLKEKIEEGEGGPVALLEIPRQADEAADNSVCPA